MKTASMYRPTVSWKRWGFFAVAMFVLPLLFGCAGGRRNICLAPVMMQYSAGPDSLGIGEFLALAPAEQSVRRARARRYATEAQAATRADIRIGKLTNAAGLAPDNPDSWLALADLWRWLGDYLHTDTCLNNAAAAVRLLSTDSAVMAAHDPDYKESSALATALQRAWLHYDRAEWRDAMPWVRAALRAEPGNKAALQIRGLLESIQGHRGMAHEIADDLHRRDEFTTDIAWILANLDIARGNDREAFNYFLGLRPDERRVAECYRDMGRVAERVAEWSYARRWYRESAAAVPFRKITCPVERKHVRISDPSTGPRLPFWLAHDESYITGSLSAYLAYAFERFEKAEMIGDREKWGGLVVNAAGICLRLAMEKPAARRVRGLVFARTDRPERALTDLTAALRESDQRDPHRAQLEAEIGHLLLVQERHAEAIGYLRRALVGHERNAQVWSDLGLALIMAGERESAAEALTQAIALDPELAAAWYNRGLMHLHAGNLIQAEADLGEAAKLAPGNMDVANLLQQVRQQR